MSGNHFLFRQRPKLSVNSASVIQPRKAGPYTLNDRLHQSSTVELGRTQPVTDERTTDRSYPAGLSASEHSHDPHKQVIE